MVVPIGMEKEEIFSATPIFFVQKFIVNGIVTALELVAKGIGISDGIFFRNGNGEICGYCAIGSCSAAKIPTSVIIKAMTIANIGL